MWQFWLRKEALIPEPLRGLEPVVDSIGYNVSDSLGVELLPKTIDWTNDLSQLHDSLERSGLVLTHASRLHRTGFADTVQQHCYYVLRFHYLPAEVAVLREEIDHQGLVDSLRQLAEGAFWKIHLHQNTGKRGPWLSVNCDGRQARFIAEDPTRPEVVYDRDEAGKKIGEAKPIEADYALTFSGQSFELV